MAAISIIELFILIFFVIFLTILLYAVFRRFARSACRKSEKEGSGSVGTRNSSGSGQQRQASSGQTLVGRQTRNIQTIYLGNSTQEGVRSSTIYTIPIRGLGQHQPQNQNFVVVVRPRNQIIERPPPTYEECVPMPPPYSPRIETV